MAEYWKIIVDSYTGYWNYFVNEVAYPGWHNYFWWLVGLSLFVWLLEIIVPWRKGQSIVRKDFWLDGFYMFFNFFLFSLIGYNAISNIGVNAFNDFLALFGIINLVAINVQSWPAWAQLLTMFVIADFIQWNIHRLLHRVPWMWEFHKVHHSVEEMGFAAHLRFHWMETIIYKVIQYMPLAMIGFGLQDFFVIHILAVAIGHLNHSNLNITYGPLKYIFNSPTMHIWHHAKKLPNQYGVNYGLSLSIWDYIFGTAYIPKSGRDEKLGFDGDEHFPKTFWKQLIYPLFKPKN
jgi:sterol desaturase/sphingolipid hydroxylase (fatty acid hydroxylase superfamily)